MIFPTISILLVEDDDLDALFVKRVLANTEFQYCLQVASTFQKAKLLASIIHFDLILTDQRLPDTEPLESVEYFAKYYPTTPIVVLSGFTAAQCYVDAIKAGAVDFLAKEHIDARILNCRIRQAFERIAQQNQISNLVAKNEDQRESLTVAKEQLEKKNKRLKALCNASRNFVNHVSHEFRTPLCVIKQYASLLADDCNDTLDDEQLQMLHIIIDRVDGLNNLVDDMLDVSRLDAGMLSAKRRSCSIVEVIETELVGLEMRASVRGVRLQFIHSSDLPPVFCEPEKAGRTLVNLVTNAIKFSKSGSLVRIQAATDTCGMVVISVVDNGPGISKEDQEKLFARFQQSNSTLMSHEKSFGLGLSIAKELTDLNLGDLLVKSIEGHGATFSFSVPQHNNQLVMERFSKFLRRKTRNPKCEVTQLHIRSTRSLSNEQSSLIYDVLNYLMRSGDLLIESGSQEWNAILRTGREGAEVFVSGICKELNESIQNCPSFEIPDLKIDIFDSTTIDQLAHSRPALLAFARPDCAAAQSVQQPKLDQSPACECND